MNYKLSIFQDDAGWWWSITDSNGDEVADCKNPFATRAEARADGVAAFCDWQPE